MLAIAYRAPIALTETFIAAHIEKIAPEQTIALLIGDDSPGFPNMPFVQLSVGRQGHSFFARKFLGAVSLLRSGSTLSASRTTELNAISEIKRYGVTAILAEYGPVGCSVRHLAKRAGVRFFVYFHGFDASLLLRSPQWLSEYKKLFLDCTGIFVPSRFLRDNLTAAGCPTSKIHVVPCGVDVERFAPTFVTRESCAFLCVGRMVEKKAPDLSLMAFSKVASRNVDASLTFVGDGPLLNHCRKLARKLGVSNRVFLLGAQSQDRIHDLMQRAGVFVQHSVTAESGDTEGLPVAILEAMASGLPVISTWHSGIPEAVEDGVSGLLVAERDVEGMGQAMLALAENPDVARRMGQAGREIVIANFGVEESISYLRKVLLHERP